MALESAIISRTRRMRGECRGVLLLLAILGCILAGPRPLAAHGILALRPGLPDREGALAAADFTVDGRLDLVVANFEAGDISLFQEEASGQYVERNPSPFLVLDGPAFIVTGDVNGDNRPDMVILDRLAGAISTRLSDPTLVFKATANLIIGAAPQAVTIADFTGNGKKDLAVTTDSSNAVFIYSGAGDGNFTFLRAVDARSPAQKSAALDVSLVGIAAADFNGDGKMDLAVTQRDTGLLVVLLGNGNGTFQTPTTLTVGTHPTTIKVARFNDDQAPGPGDDFADLAVLLEADPAATPSPFPGGAAILLGNGNGTFTAAPSLTAGPSDSPVDIAVGPIGLGAAGFDDLALANFDSNTLLLFPSAGTGAFAPPVTVGGPASTLRNPRAIALMDRDGNGVVDRIAVSNFGGYSLTLFDGGGATPFTENAASPLSATRHPVDVSVANLDAGVGDDLAIISTDDPTLETFSALDDGFFFKHRATPLPAGSTPSALLLADLNGDLIADAVVALTDLDGSAGSGTGPGFAILRGNGNATFGASAGRCEGGDNPGLSCFSDTACPNGSCGYSPAFGACAGGTNILKACATDADCPSSTCTLPPPATPLAAAATSLLRLDLNPQDADLDGVPDSVDNCPARYNPNQENTRGLTCEGGSNPGAPCTLDLQCLGGGTCTVLDPRGDACDSTTADPDGDRIVDNSDNCPDVYNPLQADADSNRVGDACDHSPDLVALEGGSNQAEVFIGQPSNGFLPPVPLPLGVDPAGMVTGSFTAGDSFPDLAFTNRGSGTLEILAGNGSGGFAAGTLLPAGARPGSLTVLEANRNDLDLDGVPNFRDNCPTRYNPGQADADGDGLGDACSQVEDPDHDDIITRLVLRVDNCPDTYNPTQTDTDGDSIGDACDINPTVYNPGDDNDLDGIPDATDNCPTRYNPDQRDSSGDGVGDACDEQIDDDGDGILTATKIRDNCPDTYNPDQADLDFNGIGDACENVQDLATVDEAGNNVELFIQSPPGSWVPLAPIPVGNHPVSIAAVDLNSDSLTDLVISNLADSTLTVLMGQGDGTFLVDPSFSTISLPAPAVAVRGGDFKFDVIQNLPEVMGISQTLQSPIILVNVISERADVDGSDQVDGRDLAIWAKGFGLSRGDPGYSSLVDADVNLDGKIDGFDLAYITLQFGKSVPLP